MEGCSSLSPWTDIYEEADLRTPTFMDSCRVISRNDEGLISWSDGGPNQHHGGTNSNTETSDEDDCISMLFNSDCSTNFWNFSSIDNQNTVISPGEIIIRSSNNDNNNNNNNNPRKRSRDDDIHDFDEDQSQRFNLTASSSPPKGAKRRQSFNTVTSRSHAKSNEKMSKSSSNISFRLQGKSSINSIDEPDREAIQQMKEMIYRAAAFRPVNFGVEPIERPKRKNVRISNDPQTAAARQRRERISERLRALQKLVPGGSKMDTASMLDEAANYLKFLRNQVKDLESFGDNKLASSVLFYYH